MEQQEQSFQALADNAFDFLTRAIKELEDGPKYSVIHFCAAVEMLLKARLMQEHWSLIIIRPESAHRDKFLAGDFASVTMEEAMDRLRDIAGEDVGAAARESFESLATHRNKMLHFFHAGMASSEEERARIISEQYRAWLHLQRLLARWQEHFSGFAGDIRRINALMKRHQEYLEAKFTSLQGDLAKARKAGDIPHPCGSCGRKAKTAEWPDAALSDLKCQVCEVRGGWRARVVCPGCGQPANVYGYPASCHRCASPVGFMDVLPALVEHSKRVGEEGDFTEFELDEPVRSCEGCERGGAVIHREGGYYCLRCFSHSEHGEECSLCERILMPTADEESRGICKWCLWEFSEPEIEVVPRRRAASRPVAPGPRSGGRGSRQ